MFSQKVSQRHRLPQVTLLDPCRILHLCRREYIGVCECVMWLLVPVPHAFLNVSEYVLWDCGLARLSWVLWCSAFPAVPSKESGEEGVVHGFVLYWILLSSLSCPQSDSSESPSDSEHERQLH